MIENRTWREEMEGYSRRIASLGLLGSELVQELKKFPGLLSFRPTDATAVKFRSLIYVNHTLTSAMEVLRSIQLLWREGHVLAATHCIRLLIELWGSLIYAKTHIVRKLLAADGPKIAAARLEKLDLGTKSGPLLPAGLTGRIQPINVMDLIRAGEDQVKGFEEAYALFCDVSHPSFMHSSLYTLTDSRVLWWENPLFEKEAHRIIEHITTWAERAVVGIEEEARTIYAECLPDVEREIEIHQSSRQEKI